MTRFIACETLLDGSGGRQDGGFVIELDGANIRAIEPATAVPDEAVRAAVVMPGMIDLHVHLAAPEWPSDPHPLVARLSSSDGYMALNAAANASDMLRSGFTTVRDLGAWGVDANTPILALRDAVERGITEGPSIFAAGWVGQTAGHNDLGLPVTLTEVIGAETADGPWPVRALVRKMIRAGCDLIKTSTGGGMGSLHEESWWPNYTPDELAALGDETHRYGKKLAVHAYHPDQIHAALDAGADTIEHGIFADDDCLTRMADLGVVWVPTLSVYSQETIDAKIAQGADDHVIRKFIRANESAGANVAKARELGVRIGCGTDVYNAGREFFSRSADELTHLTAWGLTPAEAIVAATSTAADALGSTDRGRIEPGSKADLIGLASDPTEDITALGPGGSIEWVMRHGRRVP